MFKENLYNLEEILVRIFYVQSKLSLNKYFLFHREVKYLDHMVSAKVVSIDPSWVYLLSTLVNSKN